MPHCFFDRCEEVSLQQCVLLLKTLAICLANMFNVNPPLANTAPAVIYLLHHQYNISLQPSLAFPLPVFIAACTVLYTFDIHELTYSLEAVFNITSSIFIGPLSTLSQFRPTNSNCGRWTAT